MRRGERITAVVGAALVSVAAVAAGAVLTIHGAATASAADEDRPMPLDLFWLWFDECRADAGFSPEYGISLAQDAEGVIGVDFIDNLSRPVEDAAALEQEDRLNACLGRRPFEPLGSQPDYWSDNTTVDRLMLADAFVRRTAPCLYARGLEPDVAAFATYFDPQMAPWLNDYYAIAYPERGEPVPFDELLAARRACGVPGDILAEGEPG
jgi:hypothetical protein